VAYTGQVRYQNQLYPGEQPTIVPPEIWQRVQDLLQNNHARVRGIRHYGILAGRNVDTKLAHCRQLLGFAFDRPQRRRGRGTRNRGEATHAFDQIEPQPGSGPYPNPQYGSVPSLRRVTQEKTQRKITEWRPGEYPGDAPAQLTGRQVTDDGRIIGPLKIAGQDGVAGAGEEDSHSPSKLFDLELKSSKDVQPGPRQHVKVANTLRQAQDRERRYQGQRLVQVEQGGPLPLPGTMREIVVNRWQECPQLRRG
jgi:hypothetical protein